VHGPAVVHADARVARENEMVSACNCCAAVAVEASGSAYSVLGVKDQASISYRTIPGTGEMAAAWRIVVVHRLGVGVGAGVGLEVGRLMQSAPSCQFVCGTMLAMIAAGVE
jgi:hypothetical protein